MHVIFRSINTNMIFFFFFKKKKCENHIDFSLTD